jgi:hypothetical protein
MTRPRLSIPPIGDLWHSHDPDEWRRALERYWTLIQPRNLELERAIEPLDLNRIRSLTSDGWFDFLHDEYFRWKYTARNRYATTTATLRRKAASETDRTALDKIRKELLAINPSEVRVAIEIASRIPGLGTAGASGLLALLYPEYFGTVDQFVVKALREVPNLPEADSLATMNPEGLTAVDGEVLVMIMRRQAGVLTDAFDALWTPRAVDKVLWTYGRNQGWRPKVTLPLATARIVLRPVP